MPFSSSRSWAVKKASDVLCLPCKVSVEFYREIRRRRTMRHDGKMWIERSRVDCDREKNAVIECGAAPRGSKLAKFGMLNNVSLVAHRSSALALSCTESCRIPAMAAPDAPDQPSMLWRTGSSIITGATGFLCRSFLLGLNRLEVKGYDKFVRLLDERADVNGRTKGLITGLYHLSCSARTSTLTACSFKSY